MPGIGLARLRDIWYSITRASWRSPVFNCQIFCGKKIYESNIEANKNQILKFIWASIQPCNKFLNFLVQRKRMLNCALSRMLSWLPALVIYSCK